MMKVSFFFIFSLLAMFMAQDEAVQVILIPSKWSFSTIHKREILLVLLYQVQL